MAKRKRDIQLKFRVTPQEREMIETKMAQFGTTNMAAYLRKMAIDGYVVKLDLPELRELVSLLRYSSNNLNQLTRRAQQTVLLFKEVSDMATTRLMPLHTGKGRTAGQAISDIIDYTENPQKTDGGRLITSWQCDSRIADAEFLFTKNQYIQKTGRVRGEDDARSPERRDHGVHRQWVQRHKF